MQAQISCQSFPGPLRCPVGLASDGVTGFFSDEAGFGGICIIRGGGGGGGGGGAGRFVISNISWVVGV
ncbi:MAG: hypothetical protein AB8B64_09975 [Granulosicoccus sp.]